MTAPVLRFSWLEGADRDLPLPAYETAGAAGADLRANLAPETREAGLTLAPMQRRIVPTGLSVEIPSGFEMQLRPRSGLAFKHGLTLVNTPGTIDSDYRGPLGVLLVNLGNAPSTVAHGDRIAQMIVQRLPEVELCESETLPETPRGAGGFGHTGDR